jgi:hypothetical protein
MAEPVTLENLRTANIETADRTQLETLRQQIEEIIAELTTRAGLIRARIEELLGQIPTDRASKFQRIRGVSFSKRSTVGALDSKLRAVAGEIADNHAQIASLEAQIASLTQQLASANSNKTGQEELLTANNRSLTMLKEIFKIQWAELQAAIKLLGKINEKNTIDTYDETFKNLVQSYVDATSGNDWTYTADSEEVPNVVPTDRLETFKTNNRDALGLTVPDDLNRDWNNDLTIPTEESLPGLTSWTSNGASGPTGPTGSTDIDEPSLPGASGTSEGGRRRVSKRYRTDLARKIASSLKKKPLKQRRNH